jgi:hypothetical protein
MDLSLPFRAMHEEGESQEKRAETCRFRGKAQRSNAATQEQPAAFAKINQAAETLL